MKKRRTNKTLDGKILVWMLSYMAQMVTWKVVKTKNTNFMNENINLKSSNFLF